MPDSIPVGMPVVVGRFPGAEGMGDLQIPPERSPGRDLDCPADKKLRERIRGAAAGVVAPWAEAGVPASARSGTGLRALAERIVAEAGGDRAHVGWAMVAVVSEHWRRKLATGAAGRRLLLLPDCPLAEHAGEDDGTQRPPRTCGPSCAIATIWNAANSSGWVVEGTPRAVAAIGGLLTGQYDGILGVARLEHLEKAFGMLPAFALPIAAVPYAPDAIRRGPAPCDCATATAAATLDVEWVLALLGVGGTTAAAGADHLPLLREAAGLFTEESLRGIAASVGVADALAWPASSPEPLEATATLGARFLGRGGKFLRPFITLAAHDAVRRDLGGVTGGRDASRAAAVAIEVFHKASLIHDDVEDSDTHRYGQSTLHREVGVPLAVNTGDALLGFGYRIIAALPGVDASTRADLVGMLAEAHVRLARGQGAELWWRDASQRGLSVHDAIEIYALKTAPAFEVSLAIGIRLGGGNPAALDSLAAYSRHVGVGFQILNDLKDWRGDAENERQAAGDLLGGRPTLLWALARERVPTDELRRLAEAVATAGDDPVRQAGVIADARRLFAAAEVFDRAVAFAEASRASALAAIAAVPMASLRKVLEFLLDLAIPGGAAARLMESA